VPQQAQYVACKRQPLISIFTIGTRRSSPPASDIGEITASRYRRARLLKRKLWGEAAAWRRAPLPKRCTQKAVKEPWNARLAQAFEGSAKLKLAKRAKRLSTT